MDGCEGKDGAEGEDFPLEIRGWRETEGDGSDRARCQSRCGRVCWGEESEGGLSFLR